MSKSAAKSCTLLSYKEGLSNADRKRYDAKLVHIGGCDPYEEKLDWTKNVDILPSVTYPDIVTYLLFSPSVYSADDLKAYKSLDAYNQFVCGWVRDTVGIKHGDNVVVSAKVLHSQRMREKPLRPWIIAKSDGNVITAHCDCMAGLGEACSHVAALLFYIESAVKIRDSKTVTEEKAYWLLPSACRSIQPKTIFEIDFVSAKTAKKQLDSKIEASISVTPVTLASSTKKKKTVPVASSNDFLHFCQSLSNISSNPAILAVVEPSANRYVPKQESKDYPLILTELRDEDCLKLNYKELSEKCANVSITCSKLQAENVEEETRGQSQSKFWHSFRAGRITASRAKAVVSTNKAATSQSLVKDICYPGDRKVEIPATKWGCDHEKDAIGKFMEEIGPLHENSRLQNSGFVISQDVPYIGASPDAIFICDCCGPACVEVKCPYNARCEEINENTIPFLHRQNNELELKHDHQYYYQVQTQLGVSKHEVGYFVVWTENSLHVEAVMFDNQLWDTICACAKEIMYSAILQELVGKFFTRMPVTTNVLQSIENSTKCNKGQITRKGSSELIHTKSDLTENDEALYCFCNQVEHGKMIGCDNEACEIEWFHYRCVNIEIAPKGKWFCPDCRKLPDFKRKRHAKK